MEIKTGDEVKQKNEVTNTKYIRFRMPLTMHKRIKKHQLTLTGKPTIEDAARDLIRLGLQSKTQKSETL
jgi:hypothetical protein